MDILFTFCFTVKLTIFTQAEQVKTPRWTAASHKALHRKRLVQKKSRLSVTIFLCFLLLGMQC